MDIGLFYNSQEEKPRLFVRTRSLFVGKQYNGLVVSSGESTNLAIGLSAVQSVYVGSSEQKYFSGEEPFELTENSDFLPLAWVTKQNFAPKQPVSVPLLIPDHAFLRTFSFDNGKAKASVRFYLDIRAESMVEGSESPSEPLFSKLESIAKEPITLLPSPDLKQEGLRLASPDLTRIEIALYEQLMDIAEHVRIEHGADAV